MFLEALPVSDSFHKYGSRTPVSEDSRLECLGFSGPKPNAVPPNFGSVLVLNIVLHVAKPLKDRHHEAEIQNIESSPHARWLGACKL